MTRLNLYNLTNVKASKLVTKNCRSSFTFATILLTKDHRDATYSIYGFVRYADEIVDALERDFRLALEGLKKLPRKCLISLIYYESGSKY